MGENLNGNEEAERCSPELFEHIQTIKGLVGEEEGELTAKHEELRFELGRVLEELIEQVPGAANREIVADPQRYVDTHLTAPKDSPLRQQLIAQFEPVPEANEFVELLKEMEKLVTTP
jgi:hypothetical protein